MFSVLFLLLNQDYALILANSYIVSCNIHDTTAQNPSSFSPLSFVLYIRRNRLTFVTKKLFYFKLKKLLLYEQKNKPRSIVKKLLGFYPDENYCKVIIASNISLLASISLGEATTT